MSDRNVPLTEVLFEFIPQGRYVKVCAVDPVSKMEVSIVGDVNAPQMTLKRLAIRKLQYVLNKQAGQARQKDDKLF